MIPLRLLLTLFTLLCCTTISSASIQDLQEGVVFEEACLIEGETVFSAEFIASKSVLPGTPVGRRGQQVDFPNPNHPKPRNAPGSVRDREYSGHAFDRMQERGYTPSVVENAIQNGTRAAGKTPVTSYFPTGGLPRSIHSGSWNLKKVDSQVRRGVHSTQHFRLHERAYRAEQLALGHALLNSAKNGGKVLMPSEDCN